VHLRCRPTERLSSSSSKRRVGSVEPSTFTSVKKKRDALERRKSGEAAKPKEKRTFANSRGGIWEAREKRVRSCLSENRAERREGKRGKNADQTKKQVTFDHPNFAGRAVSHVFVMQKGKEASSNKGCSGEDV